VLRREPANLLNQCSTIEGTGRALLADMYDADAIEAINFEQLATITDRLLLRRGRRRDGHAPKDRYSIPSLAHARHARVIARGSQPHLEAPTVMVTALPAPVVASKSVVVSAPPDARAPRAQWFAVTVVIPTLVGIVLGLAAML
jgi:hypothetical protein